MSDAAIPVATTETVKTETPVPAAAAPATPTYDPEKQVVLNKEEAAQLRKDAARAAGSQRKADLFDRFSQNGAFGNRPAPAEDPAKGAPAAESVAKEERKAERGLTQLALDPEYRDVFDADPTLRAMFANDPLSVLPVLAPDALDAQDAIALVKEKLAERKAGIRKPETKVDGDPKPVVDPSDKVPPAGGINTTGTNPNPEYEAAKKLPHAEQAVAGMLGARFRELGGKK